MFYVDLVVVTKTFNDLVTSIIQSDLEENKKQSFFITVSGLNATKLTGSNSVMVTGIELAMVQYEGGQVVTGK